MTLPETPEATNAGRGACPENAMSSPEITEATKRGVGATAMTPFDPMSSVGFGATANTPLEPASSVGAGARARMVLLIGHLIFRQDYATGRVAQLITPPGS